MILAPEPDWYFVYSPLSHVGPQHFQIASPNTGGNRPHDVSLNWILFQFVRELDRPMAFVHYNIVQNKIYDSQNHCPSISHYCHIIVYWDVQFS